MKILRIISLIILTARSLAVLAEQSQPLTLADCYSIGKQASESLMRKDEDVKAAEAKYKEAISLLYPKLTASLSQRFKNTASNNSGGGSNLDSSGGFQGQGKHPFQTTLSVKQPIFSGFRDLYLAESSKSDIKAIGFDRERSAQLLYSDIAEVFNQVVYYGEDLKLLSKAEEVLSERIVDLKRFIDLGKSRESEIQAAQSDLADVGATKARVQGLLGASKEMLAFLLNRNASTLVLKDEPLPILTSSIDGLLDQSKSRADIQAAIERLNSAQKQRKAAEREHWPVFSLEGNYYPYQDPDSERDWDVLFKLDLPLYDAGEIDARIAQSKAAERSSALSSQEGVRVAEREVRTAYNNLEASQSEVNRLKALLNAAKKNFEAQRRDYELGVVTNLDVLAAIRTTLDAARRLLDAETTLKVNFAKLKVSAGDVQ